MLSSRDLAIFEMVQAGLVYFGLLLTYYCKLLDVKRRCSGLKNKLLGAGC